MKTGVKMVNGELVPMSQHDLMQVMRDKAEAVTNLMPQINGTQLRLALLGLGVTAAQVEAAIDAVPGDAVQRETARIQWEYATSFQRQHPLIATIGAALGMTEAQIDEAWLHAATL